MDIQQQLELVNECKTLRGNYYEKLNSTCFSLLANFEKIGFDNTPFRVFISLLEHSQKLALKEWLEYVSNQTLVYSKEKNKYSVKAKKGEKSFIIYQDKFDNVLGFLNFEQEKQSKPKTERTKDSYKCSLDKMLKKYVDELDFTEDEILQVVYTSINSVKFLSFAKKEQEKLDRIARQAEAEAEAKKEQAKAKKNK